MPIIGIAIFSFGLMTTLWVCPVSDHRSRLTSLKPPYPTIPRRYVYLCHKCNRSCFCELHLSSISLVPSEHIIRRSVHFLASRSLSLDNKCSQYSIMGKATPCRSCHRHRDTIPHLDAGKRMRARSSLTRCLFSLLLRRNFVIMMR
jgi:hypothetical protein